MYLFPRLPKRKHPKPDGIKNGKLFSRSSVVWKCNLKVPHARLSGGALSVASRAHFSSCPPRPVGLSSEGYTLGSLPHAKFSYRRQSLEIRAHPQLHGNCCQMFLKSSYEVPGSWLQHFNFRATQPFWHGKNLAGFSKTAIVMVRLHTTLHSRLYARSI